MSKMNAKFVVSVLCSSFMIEINSFSGEISLYSDPLFCNDNEYFNSLKLKCIECDPEKNLKPTKDKLSCTCNSHSKIVKYDNIGFPKCEPCPNNQFPTEDLYDCIACSSYDNNDNASLTCQTCAANQVKVERDINGSLKEVHCLNCTSGTLPSDDGKFCIPCPFTIGSSNCSCLSTTLHTVDDKCISRDVSTDWPDETSSYIIQYESGINIDSYFFRRNLRSTIFLCKMKDHKACQMLANMCAMVMFNDYRSSPCRIFQDSKHIPTSESNSLPWLYYGEGDAQTVLNRKKIPVKYSLSSTSWAKQLNLTVIRFSANGDYNGISRATGSFLQLCPGSWAALDSGLRFGTQYHYSCEVPASQLAELRSTEFFDLYLQYWEGADSLLYAVPILTKNLKEGKSSNNKASDYSQWMLTRRFFFIDKLSGIKTIFENKQMEQDKFPSVIRFLKSCKLRIRVQDKGEEGRIYPPLLVVTYGEITQDDIDAGTLVTLDFSVTYDMPSSLLYAIEVSMGVLCSLAVIWSGIETWSYSRRSGRVAIDVFTLAHLILFACGNLANVFFLVVASASLHTFIFYKGQSVVHVLLPNGKEEEVITAYIIVALLLKVIEVVHLVWRQISIDIFFIDWERPRARSSIQRHRSHFTSSSSDGEQEVSIWRTYFVANEWNEIQTNRKTSLLCQLFVTVFCLKVVGLEQWAVADPELHTSIPDYMATSPPSMICRFAVGILVYTVAYIIQLLFMLILYERYVRNEIQQFIDICSMANISVFILSLENFGYYIHGRSSHGFADTDLQTILGQLQREQEDLCGHRGLTPGMEEQTFQMAIPHQLRSYYRKVVSPISSMATTNKRLSMGGAGGLRTKMASGNMERSVQAYHSMNKFLGAYLEHALKDIDYEVREKSFMESLFDLELAEVFDKGIFYADARHSFDKILFHGNEITLATLDIMVFSFIEILFHDFLLAIILTGCIAKLLIMIRSVGGRKNLTRKTLIDERFLI